MANVINGLTFVHDLTGEDVFEIWRQNEENLPHWQVYWRAKGFASWEEWRRSHADAWKMDERTWALYRVNDPLATVAQFRGGPFGSWIDTYYEGKTAPTFAELADNEKLQALHEREGRISNFPAQTTLTGIIADGDIIVIEGMHRAASLAIAQKMGVPIESEVFLALAEVSAKDISERLGKSKED